MLSSARKLWRRGRELLPVEGFYFDRPIVVLQSDDWGRAGVRDQAGWERLRAAGLALGERPYDLYSLETADDLAALRGLLLRHRDSAGRAACLGMNFMAANLDLAKMETEDFQKIYLLPLAEGLPEGWNRPGLLDAYRSGIESEVFHPALHGLTHFCRAAVERRLSGGGERAALLRMLWQAGTPYIHWRMPWIGYEYWDPEREKGERFLAAGEQERLIGQAVGLFSKLFSRLPGSACAPGYRANEDTHRAWGQYGIRVAQNGPGTTTPPHVDGYGVLQLYRNVELEPATQPSLRVEDCIHKAEACFACGIPAIVAIHSINFHSAVGGFRERTMQLLDQFLSALEARNANVLYLHDEDLRQLVENGGYDCGRGSMSVNVIKKKFSRRVVDQGQKAG